ncbi:MAG: hypothetical protein CMF96_01235 [Candidatus Marinimicrobia bacterium]|nr:hypothetical protein [Candidatus Neomarinimicrobiota bacterium]
MAIKFIISLFFIISLSFSSQYTNIQNFKFIDGLSSNNVTDITIDEKNRIWLGTYNGISMFNGNSFQNFYNDEIITEKSINCTESNELGVWFGTNNALLKMYESDAGIKVQKYLEFPNGIMSIALIGSRVYALSKNKLFSINTLNKQYKEINFGNIKKVIPYEKKLIVTTNSMIYLYDIKTGDKKILKKFDSDINLIDLKDSELFVGTNSGLYKYKIKNSNLSLDRHLFKNKNINAIGLTENQVFVSVENKLFSLNESLTKNKNISIENIRSIQATQENILFIGSFGEGLYKIDPNSFKNYSVLEGKNNVRVNSSLEFKNDIFLATEKGFYSQKQDEFLFKGNIFDIEIEKDNIIWLATQKGIYTYANNKIKKIKLEGIESNIIVLSIMIDKMGIKWFGTTKGLIKYDDRKQNKFIYLYNTADGLISNVIYDICQIPGGIAATSSNGITYFKNYKNIIPLEYTSDEYNSCVYDYDSGLLWASTTQSGIKKIDIETGEIIESYSTSNGLNNNEIFNLIIDDNSTLYVSTDGGGVSIYNGEVWSSLDSRDGLVNNTVYHVYIARNGDSVVSTKSGYSIYSPKTTNSNIKINQIIGATKNRNSFSVQEGNKVFINLSPVDYITNPQKYIFRYNLGNEWQYSFGNTNIEINAYKSGTYNINVEFIDRDLNVSESEKVKLVVLKPWYLRTNIAVPLYGGTLILLITTIFSLLQFFKKRKESEALKEADLKRQYEEMEEARKFQMGMLPDKTPAVLNLDIATHINTADEVGGDYYDFFIQKKSNSLIVAIGDATGHGMIAGNIVSITKAGLNSVNFESPINEILENLNKIIKKVGIGRNRMCLNICHVTDSSFEICSAGMPPTYLFKRESNTIEEVMISGLPAGSLKNSKYSSEKFDFNKNDILVMITDGLPECENSNGEYIGYERIKETILNNSDKSAGEIKSNLANLGKNWMAGSPITDDITFVVIKKC